MNPSKAVLDQALLELEKIKGVSEHEIETRLLRMRNTESQEEPCQEWHREVVAFSFREGGKNADGHGTYFGPMMIWQTDKGETVGSPSLQQVNNEVLSYWQQRAVSTNNPILKARYAGLVWDLSKPAADIKPDHKFALIYCDALLRIADERCHEYEVDIIRKLERALSVAINLRDALLIERVKKAIIAFEKEVAEDSKLGLWGFCFDQLVGNKKVGLTKNEEHEIITTLEERLARLKGGEPWKCEHAAIRLANYYRRKGNESECSRVIRDLGGAFERAAANAAPLAASSALEHMHQVYLQFNLREDAAQLSLKIREFGQKVREQMKPISHKMQIPQLELERFYEAMLEGSFEDTLNRIAHYHIPKRGEIETQLNDLSQKAVLSFQFTKQLTDHQGRIVASIRSLADDLEGNIIHQMSQNMACGAMFLVEVLDRTIRKYIIDEDRILKYLLASPVFRAEQEKILLSAIRSYLQADFLSAIHLFVTQIEAVIRHLVETSGGAVLKPSRAGGFHLRSLDELLRTDQVISAVGEDCALYFRAVLTDQRGWNIRNDVCHGISPYESFSRQVADRLLHICLVLAQLRVKGTK